MSILSLKIFLKGDFIMNTGSFVKGMMTGAVVGAGIAMIAHPMDGRDRRKIAKQTSRMFTTIGSVADNLMDVFR